MQTNSSKLRGVTIIVANDVFFIEGNFSFSKHLYTEEEGQSQIGTMSGAPLSVLDKIHPSTEQATSTISSSIADRNSSLLTPTEDSPTQGIPLSSGQSMPSEPPAIHIPAHVHHMKTRVASGIVKMNPKYALLTCASPSISNGFSNAVKDERWKEAMDAEMSALHSNRTWILVQPNPSMNVLSCKWVSRQKFDESGNIKCFEARLVANGMHQFNGVDVAETFAPVVKPASVKLILNFAVTWGWELS